MELPKQIEGLPIVVSISGGKDSAALALALREAGIPVHSYVFADTGWEHPDTYEHVRTIERVLGIEVVRVGHPEGMAGRARHKATFPSRRIRWCTDELKITPINVYLRTVAESTGSDVVVAVGVRAEESEARSKQPPLEWETRDFGRYVWRPIQSWTIAEVIAAHHRAGLPLNPLYHAGFDRVGCYPCIFSQKNEIRLIAERSPERIAEIEALEAELTALRAERNAEKPGRYKLPTATFFVGRDIVNPTPIGDVVAWSRTARGGKQLPLLPEPPEGGCLRWGICESPKVEAGA